ncbi:type 2 lanthipeptide synthetase LanM family protein [Kitasatospora sp. NPDC058965]|uniref:type 2 lanthipeptide synthetase LanM family protein n=1 Tax=Kitasatospora sp. NPDC058965 TaxID=3346682 RepID=UPI0036A21D1C
MTEMGTDEPGTLWWTRGLSRAERLPLPAQLPLGEAELTKRWAADYAGPAEFAARLAELGLTEPQLAALAAEPAEQLAARVAVPSWAAFTEQVLAAAPERVAAPAEELDWATGFALVLAPFTALAADRLPAGPELAELVDLAAVRACFTEQLTAALVRTARRTLVLELNVARVTGRLDGDTPARRFADFTRRSAERPALRALLTEYPVLARLLAQTCEQGAAAWTELLGRLAADRTELVAGLLPGGDPGRLVSVETGRGDRHDHGRTVALLRFEHGAELVYKPRPVELHARFNETLAWLGAKLPDLQPRALAVLARDGYGWVEFATAAPCRNRAEVRRFYRRLGALLALVHTLGGTDLHYENLLACADQPVLVDLETLCHPALVRPRVAAEDPALGALEDSVRRTALLPVLRYGADGVLDLSGLGGDKGVTLPVQVADWAGAATDEMHLVRTAGVSRGGANRPRLDGVDADPARHTDALLGGYRAGYQAIAAHRAELAELLTRFADCPTRVLVRDTARYATLLDESCHPDALREGLDRDHLLDTLWRESAHNPAQRPLVGAELAELWRGDVPLVTARAGRTGLRIGGFVTAAPVLGSGLDWAEQRLERMGGTDRFDQEWVIQAALAVRDGDTAPGAPAAEPGPGVATVPDPERLLAAACAIADRILAAGHDDGRRVNWLGLEPLDERNWALLPLGAGLPHGYCGTALFLAQLAALTGVPRYATQARRALAPVPALLNALAAHPQQLPEIGAGFAGLGGISYALGQLAVLLDDRTIADWLGLAVRLTELAGAGAAGSGGVLEGDAGALAALVAVHADGGPDHALTVAGAFADRLLTQPREAFGHGLREGDAGAGLALLRFASAGGGPEYARAGLDRLRAAARQADRSPVDAGAHRTGTGWCDPLDGVALAIADSGAHRTDPELAALLDRALRRAARRPIAADHSLCHGEAGTLDLLLSGAADGPLTTALHTRAGTLLACLDRFGPRCGTPEGLSSPGLLSGLAGIGHQLLRLGFRPRIPSVLLLQPATPAPPGGRHD